MAKFKSWYMQVFQLSPGRMNRAIATFLFFFLSTLSFPPFAHAAQVTLAWDASTDPRPLNKHEFLGRLKKNTRNARPYWLESVLREQN